jgi:hypothetical protein
MVTGDRPGGVEAAARLVDEPTASTATTPSAVTTNMDW